MSSGHKQPAPRQGQGPSKHAPAGPRTDRRYECDGKVQYPDRRAARTARKQFGAARGDHLRVYRCHYGPHYHLGHVRPHSLANDDLIALAELDPLAAHEARIAALYADDGLDAIAEPNIIEPDPTDHQEHRP